MIRFMTLCSMPGWFLLYFYLSDEIPTPVDALIILSLMFIGFIVLLNVEDIYKLKSKAKVKK